MVTITASEHQHAVIKSQLNQNPLWDVQVHYFVLKKEQHIQNYTKIYMLKVEKKAHFKTKTLQALHYHITDKPLQYASV